MNSLQHCGMKKILPVNRKVQGVSFEIPLLEAAKKRARARKQSLSAYINSLIHANVTNNSQQIKETSKEN